VDGVRYVHQLGSLARIGVQAVMHNTLAASDYGLIDEATLAPRPNYWSAVLWRRLMGSTVLEAAAPRCPTEYVYAHCLTGHKGGGGDGSAQRRPRRDTEAEPGAQALRYSLAADDLLGSTVKLNGAELKLAAKRRSARHRRRKDACRSGGIDACLHQLLRDPWGQ